MQKKKKINTNFALKAYKNKADTRAERVTFSRQRSTIRAIPVKFNIL